MGWIKRWRDSRRQSRFTKAFRTVLDERKETLDPREYQKCRAACDDKGKMKALLAQTRTAPGLKGGIQDWDWEAIMAWINDFLIPLIKTLLPLLVMLDERK
jgi:hypothetical protein